MEDLFEITIDFDKNEDKPERIFKTIASLLEDLNNIDKMLCETVPIKVKTKTYLEHVENGSIKIFLRNAIDKVDDDSLAQGDFKKTIGLYLKDAKYVVLSFLDKEIDKDSKKKNLQKLQEDIFEKSRKYELDELKTYKIVQKVKLAENIASLNKTFGSLTAKESIRVKQKNQTLELAHNPELSLKTFEEEVTEKIFTAQTPMILKIKKADFLGDSQWEFKHGGKTIFAKIADTDWLKKFQCAEIIAKPQDSLDCSVRIETRHDNNNDLIDINHEITKVHKVVFADSTYQKSFDYGL